MDWNAEEATEIRLCVVPVADVAAVMDEVVAWVAAALESAVAVVQPVEQVRARLASGEYRLMLGGRGDQVYGAVVFEVMEMRGVRWLFVVAAGGAVGKVFAKVAPAMWRALIEGARREGMGVRLVGRPGWARWCARHGGDVRVRVKQVVIEAR